MGLACALSGLLGVGNISSDAGLAIFPVSIAAPRDGFEMILDKLALSLSPWGTIAVVPMDLEGIQRTSAMTNVPESAIRTVARAQKGVPLQ